VPSQADKNWKRDVYDPAIRAYYQSEDDIMRDPDNYSIGERKNYPGGIQKWWADKTAKMKLNKR